MGTAKRHVSLFIMALSLALTALAGGASAQEPDPPDHFAYLPVITRPVPDVTNIREPLLVDGEAGRLYARATVDGVEMTVVLATDDGRYLDRYPYAGRLALDRTNQVLVVDRGAEGVVLLDALTGAERGTIHLPGGSPPADPQIDPGRGVDYLFRENTVYTVDVSTLAVTGAHTLSVPIEVCGIVQGEAPVTRSFFDLISSTLYVSFNTWVCTPHLNDSIFVYDALTLETLGSYEMPSRYEAVPFSGNIYGLSYAAPVGLHVYWALSRSELWYEEQGGGNLVALTGSVVDWGRGLLYETMLAAPAAGDVAKQIRISATDTRLPLTTLTFETPWLLDARLAGHDPHSDQLYFLDNGALTVVATTSILPVDHTDLR